MPHVMTYAHLNVAAATCLNGEQRKVGRFGGCLYLRLLRQISGVQKGAKNELFEHEYIF